MNIHNNHSPEYQDELLLEEEVDSSRRIVLYNDDVNTFDWVIDSLIDVCRHQREQAEQCSLIVHYKGRCAVKEGGFTDLKPMCEALLDRGLSATIE
ncbi:MAG: ATP-dependent Clp protease adaptor ClpS [Bacteroidota bacterium]